jgi:hypothetical protein
MSYDDLENVSNVFFFLVVSLSLASASDMRRLCVD